MFEGMKTILKRIGIDPRALYEKPGSLSINLASSGGHKEMVSRLRSIVPVISAQEEGGRALFNSYWELKRRSLHAFQCGLMIRALEGIRPGKIVVADIGDSAGTHMIYLRELTKGKHNIDSVSINLDPRAIEKIKARGLKALLCRAEELDLGGISPDIFTSFEMVEHLHDPSAFFHRLSGSPGGGKMVMTVPYVRQSRVGLHNVRRGNNEKIYAEDEHIFELSPKDWTLLLRHSGWKVAQSEIYYQYPRRIPLVNLIFRLFWTSMDYEGFWGAILEKETSVSDKYNDWQ